MTLQRRLGAFGASIGCALMLCAGTPSSDKADVVNRARAAYYNLASHGVKEFRCGVSPDWKKFLASSHNKTVAEDDPFLRRLRVLQFELEASISDQPKVTPSTSGAIVLDENVMQLISGVKQTVEGFFETWRGFTITNPFDGCDVDSLEEGPDSYRISTNAPGLEAKTVMNKEFTITEVLAEYGESKVRVAPKFVMTSEGLLLDSVSNEIDGGKTRLVEKIEYADVDGLKLPGKVHVDATQASGHFIIDLSFVNYQIRRK